MTTTEARARELTYLVDEEGFSPADAQRVVKGATEATEIRKPAYAYHEIRPGGGLPLTEWAIERQLSLAHDYEERDLVVVLLAMNPDLDESIAADIERLLDLGEQVAAADELTRLPGYDDDSWRMTRDMVIDEYAECLRKLARLVRGGRR